MTRRSSVVSLLFLLSFILLSPPAASAALDKKSERSPSAEAVTDSSDEEGTSAYRIGAQNLLQIKIFGEAGINQLYRIDENGYTKHALAGRVKLGGLTVSEAEKQMEEVLADGYIINPQVNIFVLEYSHFSIIGEVRKPGSYEISGRTSVIRAISMAGGFTPIADQRGVQIIRRNPDGTEEKIKVDVGRLMQGDQSSSLDLQAEDVIVVPKSFF